VSGEEPRIKNPLPEGCVCPFELHRTISEATLTCVRTRTDPQCPIHRESDRFASEALVAENVASACHHCGGGVGEFKASAWRKDTGKRFFCHNDTRSCYNECRGRYFD
jgi:hypothetical protein